MSVSAAKGSNFGREKPGVYATKDRNHAKSQHLYQKGPGQDNIELSQSAIDLLKSIQEQTQNLLKKYPQYKNYFIDARTPSLHSPISQAIHFLGKTNSFLKDPELAKQQQSQAEEDQEFSKFYEEIHRLANHNEEALKKIQAESKAEAAPTYHKLF